MKKPIKWVFAIVLVCSFLFIEHHIYGAESYQMKAVAEKISEETGSKIVIRKGSCPKLPKNFVNGLSKCFREQRGTQKRTALTLGKISKNVVLESTRGAKEMAIYQKAAPAVVIIATNSGYGSGSIIDGKGHVITNWHVVKNHPEVIVIFKPKDSAELTKELAFPALVEKIDQLSDLALLKIKSPPKVFTHLKLGDSSALAVGQDVHAIGHPSGEIWTYTKGIISQIRSSYEWRTAEGSVHHAKVIQTQTPINPGSSGGPLIDDRGALIGINSFQKSGEALNYAVAVSEIKDFLQRKEERKIRQIQPAQEIRCNEPYDTTGGGWANIVGCYQRSDSPSPDFWLIYESPDQPAAYAAVDSQGTGHIDMLITSEDQGWQNLWYCLDLDCDGIVDLIGNQYAGEEEISSYRKPIKKLSIAALATELDAALKSRKIPYPKLQVCQ